MQLGMSGLGGMEANMARRLMRGGHGCVVRARGEADFQNRLLSAMRFEFGGHVEKRSAS